MTILDILLDAVAIMAVIGIFAGTIYHLWKERNVKGKDNV
jgi:hypothetical protein